VLNPVVCYFLCIDRILNCQGRAEKFTLMYERIALRFIVETAGAGETQQEPTANSGYPNRKHFIACYRGLWIKNEVQSDGVTTPGQLIFGSFNKLAFFANSASESLWFV